MDRNIPIGSSIDRSMMDSLSLMEKLEMSSVTRNKGADQLRSNCEADQCRKITLLSKSKISSL